MYATLAAARPFFVIAGPCVVESTSHCLEVAARLRDIGDRLEIPIVFKASFDKANRRCVDSYRGPGLEAGLHALRAVRDELGMPVTTDVHETDQVGPAAEGCDVLQIPALLCRQTDLICAAARSGRVVNIKKGQFASADIVLDAARKARRAACEAAAAQQAQCSTPPSTSASGGGVLLTERGNTFGYDDLVVDPRNLTRLRHSDEGTRVGEGGSHSQGGGGGGGTLVVQDLTHAARTRVGSDVGAASSSQSHVPTIGRMAAAVGVHGLFIETHDRPAEALCDSDTVYPLDLLEPLLQELAMIALASRALEPLEPGARAGATTTK